MAEKLKRILESLKQTAAIILSLNESVQEGDGVVTRAQRRAEVETEPQNKQGKFFKTNDNLSTCYCRHFAEFSFLQTNQIFVVTNKQ
jgi:hypothetical protein